MASRRIKIFLSIIASLFVVGVAFGYDNIITHPQLSKAAIKVFQGNGSKNLSQSQVAWIIQGSVDEDAAPRYLNHYYNPETNSGLNDWDEFLRRDVSGISAKEWALKSQDGFVSHTGDYSAPAILENYRRGDKARAYQGIGHILHLIQDMSVPAHTRNDSHAGGDPYENWAKQNGNVDVNKSNFIAINNLDQAFDELALYSHNNFFSKDTLALTKYAEKMGDYFYCKDNLNNKYKCFKQTVRPDLIEYKIDDPLIHSDYWNLLHLKAVGYSAGVIDYFTKQFEQIDVERQKLSFAARIASGFKASFSNIQYIWGDVVMAANVPLSDTAIAGVKVFNSFADNIYYPLSAQLSGLIPTNAQPEPQVATVVQPVSTPELVPVIETPVVVNEPRQVVARQQAPIPVSQPPQEAVVVPVAQPVTNDPQDLVTTPVLVDNVVPASVPVIEDLPPPAPVYRGSGSVTGISPDALLAQNQPTPVGEVQPQTQTENVDTFATSTEDAFTETETATTTDGVATSTDDSFATSTDPIIDETATSTDPVIADATSTDPIVPTITDFKDSVVINEVAWMGAKAQANDEWIELYNKTDFDIDLSGWTLESRNKALSVALAGVISSRGYFLLERTASTTTDVAENMVYAGALNNSGPEANVYLKNGSTTIDYIDFGHWPAGDNGKRHTMERVSAYATSTYATNWKAYGDPDAVPFAKDAKGDDIFGTPGRKNSVSGFYTPTGDIAENTIWKKEYSPYLVSSKIIVKDGAELVVEPGVVVKFVNTGSYGGSIDVQGVLRAEGTQAEPIIFTSVRDDDTDGVDSGRDGSTTPAPGDWLNLIFSNSSQSSIMRHTHVRYGGQGISYNPNGWYPTYTGAIHAKGSHPEISDSIIENTIAIGIYANDGGSPKILTNVIENTIQPTHVGAPKVGAGIVVGADASAEIVGNTLKNNSIGVRSESLTDAPVVVKDNRFDGNAKNGEFLKGYTNWNLENSGNEDVNKEGGFDIQFAVGSGQSKTIYADTMPYIIGGAAQVLEGGLLSIEPGAVFKFTVFSSGGVVQFSVNGALFAVGTAENPIVFTAIADDADGYDSNKSPVSPMPGAWKRIEFLGTSSSGSVLEHVIVRYGGQGRDTCPYAYLGGPCMEYSGAVNIVDANPTIRNVEMDDNLAIAVFTDGAANPTIEYSTIRDTKEARKTATTTIGGYGISIGPDSEPILTDNTYANNAEDVVYRE